ncbi:Hypothetical_protein [Hexamita inflata]|uniref:Hypothetical_protein n=1 Tax=Hexamita inflata TaxID=28002 RepID=A0AA86NW64_9EUKA|nr:Hypothetical protein HINF_LOCUS13494 [Hexamita inflata]
MHFLFWEIAQFLIFRFWQLEGRRFQFIWLLKFVFSVCWFWYSKQFRNGVFFRFLLALFGTKMCYVEFFVSLRSLIFRYLVVRYKLDAGHVFAERICGLFFRFHDSLSLLVVWCFHRYRHFLNIFWLVRWFARVLRYYNFSSHQQLMAMMHNKTIHNRGNNRENQRFDLIAALQFGFSAACVRGFFQKGTAYIN